MVATTLLYIKALAYAIETRIQKTVWSLGYYDFLYSVWINISKIVDLDKWGWGYSAEMSSAAYIHRS